MNKETPESWNRKHPIGTKVRYFPIIGGAENIEAETASVAWRICGTVVVCLKGRKSGHDLDHIEVI